MTVREPKYMMLVITFLNDVIKMTSYKFVLAKRRLSLCLNHPPQSFTRIYEPGYYYEQIN